MPSCKVLVISCEVLWVHISPWDHMQGWALRISEEEFWILPVQVVSTALSEYSSQQVSLCVQRRKVYRWLSLAKDPKEELLMPDNPQGPNKESTGTNKQCSAPQNTSGKWSHLVCNFSENLCYSQEQNKETNEGKGEGYSLERKIKDA